MPLNPIREPAPEPSTSSSSQFCVCGNVGATETLDWSSSEAELLYRLVT